MHVNVHSNVAGVCARVGRSRAAVCVRAALESWIAVLQAHIVLPVARCIRALCLSLHLPVAGRFVRAGHRQLHPTALARSRCCWCSDQRLLRLSDVVTHGPEGSASAGSDRRGVPRAPWLLLLVIA